MNKEDILKYFNVGGYHNLGSLIESMEPYKDCEADVNFITAYDNPKEDHYSRLCTKGTVMLAVDIFSYRGDYSHLAIGCKVDDNIKVGYQSDVLYTELVNSIGKEFPGWKGGEYEMHASTPIWVSEEYQGACSDLRIFDVPPLVERTNEGKIKKITFAVGIVKREY